MVDSPKRRSSQIQGSFQPLPHLADTILFILPQRQPHALDPLPIAQSVMEERVADKPQKMLSAKEQCEIDWQKDSTLQAEFEDFETYLAFAKAEQNRQVKVINHA